MCIRDRLMSKNNELNSKIANHRAQDEFTSNIDELKASVNKSEEAILKRLLELEKSKKEQRSDKALNDRLDAIERKLKAIEEKSNDKIINALQKDIEELKELSKNQKSNTDDIIELNNVKEPVYDFPNQNNPVQILQADQDLPREDHNSEKVEDIDDFKVALVADALDNSHNSKKSNDIDDFLDDFPDADEASANGTNAQLAETLKQVNSEHKESTPPQHKQEEAEDFGDDLLEPIEDTNNPKAYTSIDIKKVLEDSKKDGGDAAKDKEGTSEFENEWLT
eukprot:TRINITY_DN12568_c0_g3_i1.p2 TRINITY_DN12568_c0_g3~~TRINITY_DN12568_c0_g3_i1.p2  ORF type:complete len:280 (+),score=60.95 TRINITY_DN12568_c0_g3_i1:73-912(+)